MQAALEGMRDAGDDAAATVELDQTRQGRLSRMDAMQAQAMSLEANRRREQQLARLKSALKRIEAGDYGWCLECGEPIDPRRLEHDPAAPLCIACAEKAEGS
ncbi:MAG: TraR/DksA family transcriptional regulator [Gammaproteobacteria bacterium]|nr:TraR/DksA family transcriptional regulator [Gammaproteobacteria bacterium]